MWNIVMTKYVLIIAAVFFSVLTAGAFPPPQPTPVNNVMPIQSGYPVHNQTYNKIIIQSGNNTYVTISPKYPKQSYIYKDFAGQQRYPHRNYNVPSYCMHERYIYNDNFNPFCGRYRQFGNGMYIDF